MAEGAALTVEAVMVITFSTVSVIVFKPVNTVCASVCSGMLCVEWGLLHEVSLEERGGGDQADV